MKKTIDKSKRQNKFNKENLLLLFLVLIVITGFTVSAYRIFGHQLFKGKQTAESKSEESKSSAAANETSIISVDELKNKINNNEDFVLVDVQDVENYLKKHIPNSISIPQKDLTKRYKELPKDKEIIITSAGEKIDTCDICTQGVKTLASLGFSNVKNLREGVVGWETKGYPVITGQEVTFKNMDIDKLKQKIDDHEDILVIDIRDEQEYNSEHIKGAVHMSFENIISKKDQLPKNKEIIIYDKAGSRSRLVTESLVKEGILSATNLLDGFKKWKEKNYPVEK